MRAIILGSGSKGNSTLLIGKDKKILIDVGFSYPKMISLLSEYNVHPNDIDAILITHTHKDHIGGLSTFIKKNMTLVYTNIVMQEELLKIISEDVMRINEDEFTIGEFDIETIHTSHDAPGSVGFIIKDGSSSLVYVTDTGYINSMYLQRLKNKDAYIFESNHDINMLMTGPYPYILKQRVVSDKGHLSNEQSGNYLKELIGDKTKKIILAHLSETNNTRDIALKTVKDILNEDIDIDTAYQDKTLDVGEV
jgi:phosphoribosyl 1,2-cyclic phosphodiesterase